MSPYATNINALRAAADRIAGHAQRTPIATCATLDRLAGCRLYFKCEQLQKVGAFKFRGAINALLQLGRQATHVVTHSSGNHAQALALAARLCGISAHVVMPTTASPVKREAVLDYGARLISCEPTLAARETTAAAVLAETGGTLIPPYDHPWIIAGQGTATLELLEEIPDLDAIVVPVGGGGLLSGACLAASAHRAPSGRAPLVFAAEPAGADDCARSIAAGKRLLQTAPDTVADGLLTSLGEHTWPIIRDHVAQVLVVDDEAIISAMRLLWQRAKLLVEPSAAVGLAAVLAAGDLLLDRHLQRIGIILSGGNVDLGNLPF